MESTHLTLPPSQHFVIWRLAWTSLPSFVYGLYRGHTDLSIVPLGIFITSMIYWSHPVRNSWRRYTDMSVVFTGLIYQGIRARNAENCTYYYVVVSVAVICYPLSNYVATKYPNLCIGTIWVSTLLHGLIHVLGNISNVILYSGKI